MTTRLLHISDTHLGNRQYGSDIRREDFANAFEQAIQYAIDQDVDAVVHTGDLFDSRDPSLPDLNRCIDTLQRLGAAGIPFYGIVGNHERKMDDQYLDLLEKTDAAQRLTKRPKMVNSDIALYGIDAVTKPGWHAEDFTVEPPPEHAYSILCLHQLIHPPVPEIFAEHSLDEVLDRVNIDVDALALGDYHETEGERRRGTMIWYAGSTERCAKSETEPRTVSLLEISDGDLTRREKELNTREFLPMEIQFAEGDGHGHVENIIARHEVEEKVVIVTITGESNTVTSRDVREAVLNRDAAVCRVDDQRGGPDVDLSEGPSGDIESSDRLIEEKLDEHNLSAITREIEERVRTENTTKTGFDDKIEAMLEEAQAEVFAEDESAETGEDG